MGTPNNSQKYCSVWINMIDYLGNEEYGNKSDCQTNQ